MVVQAGQGLTDAVNLADDLTQWTGQDLGHKVVVGLLILAMGILLLLSLGHFLLNLGLDHLRGDLIFLDYGVKWVGPCLWLDHVLFIL